MSMMPEDERPSVLETRDEFVTEVPWGTRGWRCVIVHRRQHAGKTYIRFRTWNRHLKKGVWYPSKRGFVIPIENAEALAKALMKGVAGSDEDPPKWLTAREEAYRSYVRTSPSESRVRRPARTRRRRRRAEPAAPEETGLVL